MILSTRLFAACLAASGLVVPSWPATATSWSSDAGFPVHIAFGSTENVVAQAVATQTDGKILVAGRSGGDIAVTRLLPDGNLDPSFDGDGRALFDPGAGVDAEAVWVQQTPDGRIVVIGNEAAVGRGIAVLRLLADGSPDTAFGTDGWQRLPEGVQGACAPVPVCDAALLADGSLLVPSTRINIGGAVSVFKFLPDGTLDPDFGEDGIATIDAFPSDGTPLAQSVGLEPLPDGRMLVAVATYDVQYKLALVRLDADGAVDATFAGTAGDVATVEAGYAVTVANMQLDAEGRPVLALVLPRLDRSDSKFGALRFDTDGAPDAGFGVDGFATLLPVPDCTEICLSSGMQFDADGGLFLVGTAPGPDIGDAGSIDVALARLLPDGQIDTRFAPNGVRRFGSDDAGTVYQDTGIAIAMDAEGRVLLAGRRSGDDGDAMQVWRIRSDLLLRDGFE